MRCFCFVTHSCVFFFFSFAVSTAGCCKISHFIVEWTCFLFVCFHLVTAVKSLFVLCGCRCTDTGGGVCQAVFVLEFRTGGLAALCCHLLPQFLPPLFLHQPGKVDKMNDFLCEGVYVCVGIFVSLKMKKKKKKDYRSIITCKCNVQLKCIQPVCLEMPKCSTEINTYLIITIQNSNYLYKIVCHIN